jgi:MSHA biogenesis protein MshK
MHVVTIALLCIGCAAARIGASAEPLDDPTRPSGVRSVVQLQPPERRELRVEGIFRGDERRVAIVNGMVVHEGDRIANATIQEITADAVRYSRDGHDHTARLARTTLQVRQPSVLQVKLP